MPHKCAQFLVISKDSGRRTDLRGLCKVSVHTREGRDPQLNRPNHGQMSDDNCGIDLGGAPPEK